jgi:opine dehydrogenase
VGLATPLIDGFLAIGSAICGTDFATNGRTPANMGLGNLDRAGLRRLLDEGFR